jgi:hypothetical protein
VEIPRRKANRISESDLTIPTLRLLAKEPTGYLSTSDLIAELTEEFHPEGADAEILDGRHDTKFSQIVRNMKSHKTSANNIIALGYVIEVYKGFRITDDGRAFLKKKGG